LFIKDIKRDSENENLLFIKDIKRDSENENTQPTIKGG